MKKILALFLSLVILAQTLVNVGIGVYYNLNKQYISQKLCENRNNPAIHCNGHCYLSKQLKKAEEGENRSQSQLLKEKEELIAVFSSENMIALPNNYRFTGFLDHPNTFKLTSPTIEILTPPKIVA